MKVWYNGDFMEICIGQKVTIFRCGSGHTAFGESATLTTVTASYMVFVTESGAVVKTNKDNLHEVVDKAQKNDYHVSLRLRNSFVDMIYEDVKYWNAKKLMFENK